MRWHVTIATRSGWSVARAYDAHLRPTRAAIVRDLHAAFTRTRDPLRDELVERVNKGLYRVDCEPVRGAA